MDLIKEFTKFQKQHINIHKQITLVMLRLQ